MNILPNISELNTFLGTNRKKAINFLRVRFSSLTDEDLEDIYQDASIALFQNISSGKLESLSTSLFNYFMTICFNKSTVTMRHRFDTKPLIENTWNEDSEDEIPVLNSKISELDHWIEEADPGLYKQMHVEHQEEKIRECVKGMKEPCNKILWSLYWDNLTHKAIAEMFGYKSPNVSKTTASRCKDKFSNYLKTNNIVL